MIEGKSSLYLFTKDRYRCVHISQTQATSENFILSFQEFIDQQRAQDVRGINLKLRADQCELIPLAIKAPLEMKYHNTDQSKSITLMKWLIQGPCRFPLFCLHKVMASGFVFNLKTGKILLMQGRNSLEPAWKLPGGGVDPHEYIKQGAVREVKEETGVSCKAVGILGSRQSHKALFDVRSVYYIVLCCSEEETINIIDEEETLKAEWFSLQEILEDESMKHQLTFARIVDFIRKVCEKWKIKEGLELFEILRKEYIQREQTYTIETSAEERVFRTPQI